MNSNPTPSIDSPELSTEFFPQTFSLDSEGCEDKLLTSDTAAIWCNTEDGQRNLFSIARSASPLPVEQWNAFLDESRQLWDEMDRLFKADDKAYLALPEWQRECYETVPFAWFICEVLERHSGGSIKTVGGMGLEGGLV